MDCSKVSLTHKSFYMPLQITVLIIKGKQSLMKPSIKVQIIKDRLYWFSDAEPPKNDNRSIYFNIDYDLQYQSFYNDFGPLNLSMTYKYVLEVNKILNQPRYKLKTFIHHTSQNFAKSANSAFLMGAFQIIILNRTAEEAFEPFKEIDFIPFRDASYGECTYQCTILDCLRGLQYAIRLEWFDFKRFNVSEYQHYRKMENGDLTWIIPNKLLAFSSPSDSNTDKYGNKVLNPKDYIPIFEKFGIKSVIRLNSKTYEASGFTNNGISHHDLIFTDGTTPCLSINEPGAIAVHCKAGLGRTGCLIACYAMKHYNFNAADFIGWIRMARPGSVLGPQQHFLLQMQNIMQSQGNQSPTWRHISQRILEKETIQRFKKMSIKQINTSERDRQIGRNGDEGQGDFLRNARNKQNGK